MVMNPFLVEQVEAALDEIRPALEMDGGTVELLEITPDNVVRLSLVGACESCPMSALTLKLGIERLLKQRVPAIREILTEGAVPLDWDAWGKGQDALPVRNNG
jgi:Fe-S cluster biogenesis protein NfuA